MSSTLLRLGLWITLAVVALYVLAETYPTSPLSEYVPMSMLSKGLILGVLLVVGGVALRIFEKGASKVVAKNRCVVCRTAIPPGAIYCRAHLRSMLHREEDREHVTKTHR